MGFLFISFTCKALCLRRGILFCQDRADARTGWLWGGGSNGACDWLVFRSGTPFPLGYSKPSTQNPEGDVGSEEALLANPVLTQCDLCEQTLESPSQVWIRVELQFTAMILRWGSRPALVVVSLKKLRWARPKVTVCCGAQAFAAGQGPPLRCRAGTPTSTRELS